ncbi:MAG: RND transporter, partial [Polyangiaceae bacterium]
MIKRLVGRLVDWSGANPVIVLLVTFAVVVSSWTYASHLELRSDFLELLPRDSPGFQAFEHQLGRVGGGATLIVIVQSPDRKANEKLVDDLSAKLRDRLAKHKTCVDACQTGPAGDACRTACGAEPISYIESGTKDVHAFFDEHKWLYADKSDLIEADNTLDHQIALRSGFALDDDDAPKPAPTPAPPASAGAGQTPGPANSVAPAVPLVPKAEDEKKPALGMDQFRDRWEAKANKTDDFPTGYFATPDGTQLGIRIVSTGSGLGDASGDALVEQIDAMMNELKPKSYQPQMEYGFAGDIPNAMEEKRSLVSDAATATGIAFVLILGGIVVFFRSPWSLIVLATP